MSYEKFLKSAWRHLFGRFGLPVIVYLLRVKVSHTPRYFTHLASLKYIFKIVLYTFNVFFFTEYVIGPELF